MKTILGVCGTAKGTVTWGLLEKALKGAGKKRVRTDYVILTEYFDKKDLQCRVLACGGLIIATPVHWFNVSALTKRFIDEVFWDFSGKPWKIDGLPLGVIAACEEDGGNQAIANIVMP